jgi:glycine betaine/proline transport system permease protein
MTIGPGWSSAQRSGKLRPPSRPIPRAVEITKEAAMDWLTTNKIPLGNWIRDGVDLLDTHAAFVFDAIALGLGSLIESIIGILQAVPAVVLVLVFAAGAYALHRSWKLALLIVLSLFLIINLGYWRETTETLALVVVATATCMIVGVPIGIAAAHRPWLFAMLRPVLDLMQTIPTFVYLIPTLILFGLGVVPGLISTVIFAIPAPIRLTHLGVSSVPKALIEAGEAFGASRSQLLWKVELPHALPTIMAGLTQCIMLSLSMVVIAALVGAAGLGVPVVRALNTVNIARGFEAGLAIVILAIILDRVCKQPHRGKRGG